MMGPILLESLQIERLTVAIADLPPTLSGIKLVQLSDLHYDGLHLSEAILAEAINLCNQEKPDLILLTGDYITDEVKTIFDLTSRLKYLKSRWGTYAVLGNHDIYLPQGKKVVTEALSKINITVLWNEIATPLGDKLLLVGLADYWSKEFNPAPIFYEINPYTPRLVLSHNPDTAKILQSWRVDLQLSGHTHGGQIVIPGLGPAPILLQYLREYLPTPVQTWIPFLKDCSSAVKNWHWGQGLHRIGNNQLYVNRGLGSYFPGRLFCPPEITIITLVCA